jgi:predicted nucleic acid-binding protein
MRVVFADTLYFVAPVNPQDQWRENALNADSVLKESRLITTETVLIELLNFTAGYGPNLRKAVASFVRDVLQDGEIEVLPHTHELFLKGLTLYETRLDKGYSLTDCLSMEAMRERHIADVLTHDRHFTQEGFAVLLR